MSEISPCPKCEGKRIKTGGRQVGLDGNVSIALVCLSCRYVEFYVDPEILERLKEADAWEKPPEGAKARAEWMERAKRLDEENARKRRWQFW